MTVAVLAVADKAMPLAIPCPHRARRPYVYFLHHFRLIAASLVVISHCYEIAWESHLGSPSNYDFLINIVSGATALFVFISGFFFHYVAGDDFKFQDFFSKRTQRLLIPYLIFSLFLVGIEGLFTGLFSQSLSFIVAKLIWAVLMGTAGPAMWFIPFIFILYGMSPLFMRFNKAKLSYQIVILLGMLLLGLTINRSTYNLDKIQNVGYFLFYYLFGIFCSQWLAQFIFLIRQYVTIFLSGIAMVVCAYLQYLWGGVDNPMGDWFSTTTLNIMYFQKFAQIIFICGILSRFADRPLPFISTVANWSLGIFFTHQFALILLKPMMGGGMISNGWKYLNLLTCSLVLIGFSICLIWGYKKVLPSRWHYLIGA